MPVRLLKVIRAFVLLATFIAIAWQVENWRGRQAWKAVLLDVEASGQTLDWKTFIPDKVPDALNAAKHSIFEIVYIDAPSFEPYGYFIDFGPLFERLLEGVSDNFLDGNTNPNSFDLTFGEQLLNQTSHLTPLIAELNEAFRRPHCQWVHADATFEDGTFPVPQIADVTKDLSTFGQLIGARSMAHLNKGDSASALRELSVLIGFGRMMEGGPLIVDQFITAATASRVAEPLEVLIGHSSWEPADLSQLHQRLQGLDLLDSMWKSFYLEKLFSFQILLNFPHNAHLQLGIIDSGRKLNRAIRPAINNLPRSLRHRNLYDLGHMMDAKANNAIKRMPAGWVYQNLRRVHAYWDQHLLSPYDITRKRVVPYLPAVSSGMLGPNEVPTSQSVGGGPRPYNFLAQIVLPQVDRGLWKRLATTQTRWDLLAVLCKLQEHKAIHGAYPESLGILTDIPHDYVTGKPPYYEGRTDGSILLASLDWEKTGNPDDFKVRVELP